MTAIYSYLFPSRISFFMLDRSSAVMIYKVAEKIAGEVKIEISSLKARDLCAKNWADDALFIENSELMTIIKRLKTIR